MSVAVLEKKSLTLPAELVAEAQERSGARGLSGYVAKALATQLQLDRLDDYIAQARAINGPTTPEMRARVRAEIAEAYRASGIE